MQKKIRLQRTILILIAILVSGIIVTLLLGREDTVPVYVVASDDLDPTQYLEDQFHLLEERQMLMSEFELFEGQLVTNPQDLSGSRLNHDLSMGRPITYDDLSQHRSAGQFAAETPIHHTVYIMRDVVHSLPPELAPGDFVDINAIVEEDGTHYSSPLLDDIEIAEIRQNDIYLMVSQSEYDKLNLIERIGQIEVQLPGQKDVATCEVVHSSINDYYNNMVMDIREDSDLEEEEIDDQIGEIELQRENELRRAECFTDEDPSRQQTTSEILDEILQGGETIDWDFEDPEENNNENNFETNNQEEDVVENESVPENDDDFEFNFEDMNSEEGDDIE